MHTLDDGEHIEVDQQPQLEARDAQRGLHLGTLQVVQYIDRLEFDDHRLLDHAADGTLPLAQIEAAIRAFAGKLPILGVCLGHQAIGAAFGGNIIRAQQLMHGKTSEITTTGEGVFRGLPEKFTVNRYHSLAIERDTCPAELALTAWTYDGEIMGVRHTGFAHDVRIEGVQFHPESILTEHGHAMLKNFLD